MPLAVDLKRLTAIAERRDMPKPVVPSIPHARQLHAEPATSARRTHSSACQGRTLTAINGLPSEQRLAVRRGHVAPLVAALETWMRTERGKLSRHAEVAKAMDYMLKRWDTFSRFLGDGRICLSNNAAERALRGIALGRKSWLFAGSDRGGERAAAMYSLIVTAKLNDVDPRAWLADVLARIAEHPASRLHELLPWNWRKPQTKAAAAA